MSKNYINTPYTLLRRLDFLAPKLILNVIIMQ